MGTPTDKRGSEIRRPVVAAAVFAWAASGVVLFVFTRGPSMPRADARADAPAPIALPTSSVRLPDPAYAPPARVPLPAEVRGFFWTAASAGGAREPALEAFAKKTGLNAVVIDAQEDDGALAFAPRNPALEAQADPAPAIHDLDGLLRRLGGDGLYRIARIVVMRDAVYAAAHPSAALRAQGGGLWRDAAGYAWLDPAAPDAVRNAEALAREAYARGFDEAQFDYVRFPSDAGAVYPVFSPATQTRNGVMVSFFKAVGDRLRAAGIPTSFDIFGITCWADDGQGIGQRVRAVLPSASFLSPMVYPSHFADGFDGFANPADHPYDVVKRSLDACNRGSITASSSSVRGHFRPWLQDFNLGAVYGVAQVQEEIRAARDAGASGWLLWNARNVYAPGNFGPAH